jgi:hypothetical protein
MSLTEFFYITFGFQMFAVYCEFVSLFRGQPQWRVYAILACSFGALYDLVGVVDSLLERHYESMGVYVFALALNIMIIFFLWRTWKDRKKVTEALGAKTKALRDKIVRKLRETRKPSPVRVPV